MPAVAFSDSGNMMGAFHFLKHFKHNSKMIKKLKNLSKRINYLRENFKVKIKNSSIVGCEFHVCHDRNDKYIKTMATKFFLTKKKGYKNLIKLSSIGYIEGFTIFQE